MTQNKKQNANNIMWVEYWIQKAHPSFKEYELTADRYDDYRWICEIKLPLIEKSVKSISEKEVNAMLNASKKAAKLIDEYMKDHPELIIKNEFKGKRWEIVSDENGKFISMGMSSAWLREQGKQMMNMANSSINAVEKAITRIKSIYGSTNGLIIQAFDIQLFEDKSQEEISDQIYNILSKEYSLTLSPSTIVVKDEYVIAVAFGYKIEFATRKEMKDLC